LAKVFVSLEGRASLRPITRTVMVNARDQGLNARRWGAALAVVAASWLPAHPALASTTPCAPVQIGSDTSSFPVAWRDALEGLARATGHEGMPWSCSGGSVELTLDASGGAVLTVHDTAGRSASRRVPTVDELVPTGEALLAAPLDERPRALSQPVPISPLPAPPARVESPRLPEAPREPRLQIQALLGTRVSGPGAVGWGTGQLRGMFPIGAWSAGLWARYDFPLAGPANAPSGLEMSSVSAGFSGGRRLLEGPFELRVTLDPSLAVVFMETGMESTPNHPEGARAAFRLGAGLTGTFRIASVFRGMVGIDGEFAPAGITGLRGVPNISTPIPVYTAGLLLGVEAVIR
jgi:hypothetical protein